MTMNKVKNNIDDSKHSRKKNLLPALDKALNELDTTTNWTAKNPKEVEFNCCGSCIFGSRQFDNHEGNVVTYNVQDLQGFRWAYKETRSHAYWYGTPNNKRRVEGEYIYLQHSGKSHKDYLKLIEVLNKHGIFVSWNWDSQLKLKVTLNKYKEEVLNNG